MGTGKSSAAIAYFNEHKDERFIYITPYLNESARIQKSCPALHFVEPSAKIGEYNYKKGEHTAALIKAGRNIATTHQSFMRYTQEMLDDIKRMGYTLMIDENVDVLEVVNFPEDDLKLAIDAGYIREEGGSYKLVNTSYKGVALRELFNIMRYRELIRMTDEDNKSLFYWALPPDLLTSFKDVFILTYLFEGQSLHHFMSIYNIPYEYIGIVRDEDGGYRFGDYPGYTPEYVYRLKDMLHILDAERLNEIGDDYFALSMSWFGKDDAKVEQLKRNIYNCVNNVWGDIPAERKLWGSYSGSINKIKGRGYSKSFLAFNAKATNKYRDRDYIAYIANLFMNVNEKKYYQAHGIQVDEDLYALSIMVQWIWRSAIRDGGEVYLYIPSRRMRTLLTNWIDTVSKGGNTVNAPKV